MDHLLAADVLLGEQGAFPVVAGGSYNHLANNVFYMAGCVVDKLWQGERVGGGGGGGRWKMGSGYIPGSRQSRVSYL